MQLRHDNTSFTASDAEYISRGYAEEDIFHIRISFEYTEEQQKRNLEESRMMSREEWSARCTEARKSASVYIFPVMESIAENFRCYQYDKSSGLLFDDPGWELYFQCNDLCTTTGGQLSGRDYSHIMLYLNQRHSTAQHREICDRLLSFLTEQYSDLENLSVTVQHTMWFFDEKINREAEELAQKYSGMKCSYHGMSGRLFYTTNGLVFMKKYARSKGYRVCPREILKLSWEIEAA